MGNSVDCMSLKFGALLFHPFRYKKLKNNVQYIIEIDRKYIKMKAVINISDKKNKYLFDISCLPRNLFVSHAELVTHYGTKSTEIQGE